MRNGRAKLWAWTASIGFHVVVLAVLAVAEFSPPQTAAGSKLIPAAKVEQIRRLVESSLKIPKPKVKRSRISYTAIAEQPHSIMVSEFAETQPEMAMPQAEPVIPAASVEFFSGRSQSRRVCFVVDCSGSMKGLFGRVKKELLRSIETLQQDQYFGIIFFGGGRVLSLDNGSLIRASVKAKSRAVEFINSVEPRGQTNAIAAFEKLADVRDSQGQKPSVVFFLTDGFDLTDRNENEFLQKYLPRSVVNTIGFWPGEDDCRLLRQIAERTGGEFTRISDKENQQ